MKKSLVFCLAVTLFLGYSCAYNPYRATNRVYKKEAKTLAKTIRAFPGAQGLDSVVVAPIPVGTTNFNLRKPNYVVIHHTAQDSVQQTLRTFTLPRTQVSAHYVVAKDGTVYPMLNDYLRAWHGGLSRWGSNKDLNSSSIGIELDNNGFEPFPEPQISSLLYLLSTLKNKYNIPAENFVGHGDIAPTRKNDPNVFFPWRELAAKGFGLWYTDTTGVELPPDFNPLHALRIIGYDVHDSTAAIRAFRRHFLSDTTATLSEPDKKVLYGVMKKYM